MKKAYPAPCKIKEIGNKRYRCYFELTLAVIGGKWKPIILYHLSLAQAVRFGELRKGMHDVTERMLTRQLRELEADGLVHREVYREVPPRVEYSLTAMGASLIPILKQMQAWGVEYESFLGAADRFDGEGYEAPSRQGLAACGMVAAD